MFYSTDIYFYFLVQKTIIFWILINQKLMLVEWIFKDLESFSEHLKIKNTMPKLSLRFIRQI